MSTSNPGPLERSSGGMASWLPSVQKNIVAMSPTTREIVVIRAVEAPTGADVARHIGARRSDPEHCEVYPPVHGAHSGGAPLPPQCLFGGRIIEERGHRELQRRGSERGSEPSGDLPHSGETGAVGIAGAIELHDLGVTQRLSCEMPAHRGDRRSPGHPENHCRIDETAENPCSGEGDTFETADSGRSVPGRHDVGRETESVAQLMRQLVDRWVKAELLKPGIAGECDDAAHGRPEDRRFPGGGFHCRGLDKTRMSGTHRIGRTAIAFVTEKVYLHIRPSPLKNLSARRSIRT